MEQFWELGFKTLCSYVFLLILTRIMGRKQISELTFLDYVTGISIGTIAGTISFDDRVSFLAGLLALAFWTLWTIISNLIILRRIAARKLLDTEPLVVIREGQILEETLQSCYYNINQLLMMLREQEVFDPTEVKLGILEPDGKLSILRNSANMAKAPINNAISAVTDTAKELIIDGRLLEENANNLQLTKDWVLNELQKQGITDMTEVALAIITPTGKLYIDKRRDYPAP